MFTEFIRIIKIYQETRKGGEETKYLQAINFILSHIANQNIELWKEDAFKHFREIFDGDQRQNPLVEVVNDKINKFIPQLTEKKPFIPNVVVALSNEIQEVFKELKQRPVTDQYDKETRAAFKSVA